MSRRLRALLVDFDGTVADTADLNAKAYILALGEIGVHVALHDMKREILGRSWRDFLPQWIDDPAACAEIAARKRVLYGSMIPAAAPNHGLVSTLYRHRSRKKIALVTTAAESTTRVWLLHHGHLDLFDQVITGDQVKNHKPHPEAYQIAADRLGVTAAESLVFEDSDVGCQAAVAFGARLIRVIHPFQDRLS